MWSEKIVMYERKPNQDRDLKIYNQIVMPHVENTARYSHVEFRCALDHVNAKEMTTFSKIFITHYFDKQR